MSPYRVGKISNENKQASLTLRIFGNRLAGCKRAKQIFAAATSQMSFSPKDRGHTEMMTTTTTMTRTLRCSQDFKRTSTLAETETTTFPLSRNRMDVNGLEGRAACRGCHLMTFLRPFELPGLLSACRFQQ